nr:NAD(P)H-binding protein [Haloarchaeobius salinus]
MVADASTPVGRALVDYLSDTDYVVRALVPGRGEESLARQAGATEVCIGDLTTGQGLDGAVRDVDAICCSVRDGGLSHVLGRLDVGVGVRNLVDAASDAGRPYVVLHSKIGVGDSESGMVLPVRLCKHRILGALDATERYLRDSGVPHTIVRTGRTTNGEGTESVATSEGEDTVAGRIPRPDLAWVMVAALTTPEARNRTFEVAEVAPPTHEGVEFEWRGPEAGLVARRSGYSIPS